MKYLVLVVLFLAQVASAKTLKVAVVDTGVDPAVGHLCKSGHFDFVRNTPTYGDFHGHGSHVAGLIVRNAGDANFCIISLRYYSINNTGYQNLTGEVRALQRAIDLKVDFINISGGGPEPSSGERNLIEKALDMGIKVVVAAGNEHHDLTYDCNYFPACYDPKREVVVGNYEVRKGSRPYRNPTSNYGAQVNRWEIGTNLKSNIIGGRMGYMTGTSQATAVATGKLVKFQSQHSQ